MPLVKIRGAGPDLFLLLLGFYSFYIYPSRTAHFAVFLGLLRELYSGAHLGFETLSYGISGLILWFLVSKIEREGTLNQIILIFSVCFINLLIISILNICFTNTSASFVIAAQKILYISLYTAFLSPLYIFGVKRIFNLPKHELFSRSH